MKLKDPGFHETCCYVLQCAEPNVSEQIKEFLRDLPADVKKYLEEKETPLPDSYKESYDNNEPQSIVARFGGNVSYAFTHNYNGDGDLQIEIRSKKVTNVPKENPKEGDWNYDNKITIKEFSFIKTNLLRNKVSTDPLEPSYAKYNINDGGVETSYKFRFEEGFKRKDTFDPKSNESMYDYFISFNTYKNGKLVHSHRIPENFFETESRKERQKPLQLNGKTLEPAR